MAHGTLTHSLTPTFSQREREYCFQALAAMEVVYSDRMVSPPLACQSLISWSKSPSGRRPTTMSVTPSDIVWARLKPLVKLVADTWPKVALETITGINALSASFI